MRHFRITYTLLTLALLAPAAVSAQEPVSVYSVRTHRGMLGILTEAVRGDGPSSRQRVVMQVVEDSPAEKAGLMKGDTILSINGLAASAQAMNLPLEPGDEVTLRVRRDGRERDVRITAAKRTSQFEYRAAFPDSVGERIAIIMDKVRAGVDTLTFPNIHVRGFGDSTSIVIVNGDTIRAFGFPDARHFRLHADSLISHFRTIELPRMLADSGAFRFFTNDGDSVHFRWSVDTADFVRPFEVFSRTATLGLRAVAGAELSPLNPELAQYFGATEGVLVLNARDGTPAARAGLRAGDVIVQVNGQPVDSIGDLRRRIDDADAPVRLRVLRRGETLDVTLDRE